MNDRALKFTILLVTSTLLIAVYAVYSNSKYSGIIGEHFDKLVTSSFADPWTKLLLAGTTTEALTTVKQQINTPSPRIFCIILTSKKSLNLRGTAVYGTWATKCDAFKFITKIPDYYTQNADKNKNKIKLEDLLDPPGLMHDSYDKLTDKMFFTLKYLYTTQANRYDFYLKADDDSFIFVDNLRAFLRGENSSEPVTYGFDFKVIVPQGYHSGGGSYVLTNEAFQRIGRFLNTNFSSCANTGVEDVEVAMCLRSQGVYPKKSIDSQGRERFHPFDIQTHYAGGFPDWFYSYASNPIMKGLDCCSDTSISFHYMPSDEMYRASSFLAELETANKEFRFKDLIRYLSY